MNVRIWFSFVGERFLIVLEFKVESRSPKVAVSEFISVVRAIVAFYVKCIDYIKREHVTSETT